MNLPAGYPYKRVFLQYSRKTKTRFTNLIENEIASLGNVKTQSELLVKFSIIWDDKYNTGKIISFRGIMIFST